VNGDAYADIVIGGGNSAHIIFGSASIGKEDGGPANSCSDGIDNGPDGLADVADTDCHRDLSVTPANVTVTGAEAVDGLGRSVNVRNVTGTNFNGSDKIPDVLIGAQGADGADNSRTDAGEVYVLRGRTSWPSTINLANGEQTYTVYGKEPGDLFGTTVYAGDVNGNSISDILVGSNGDDGPGTGTSCGTGQIGDRCNAGGAYLVYGSSTLGYEDGVANGCGDGVNNDPGQDAVKDAQDPDCFRDLATTPPDLLIYRSVGNAANAISAIHTGHLTDDRFEDVIVGDGIAIDVGPAGKTFVIRGSSNISGVRDLADPDDYDFVLTGDRPAAYSPSDYVGFWVIAADIDGNGISDLVSSAPYADGINDTRANAGDVFAVFDADLDGIANYPDDNDDNDLWLDGSDNCTLVYQSDQDDADSDGVGDACEDQDGDSEGLTDGPLSLYFRDSVELAVGTSRTAACSATPTANDEATDAWPPDFNDDQKITIADLSAFYQHYPPPDPYSTRFDLDADGDIDEFDVNIFMKYFTKFLNVVCP
jgi:hypothetical protein